MTILVHLRGSVTAPPIKIPPLMRRIFETARARRPWQKTGKSAPVPSSEMV